MSRDLQTAGGIHRIFFALRPDNATTTSLQETQNRLKSDGIIRTRPLAASRLHLTLHFLNDFPYFPGELIARVSHKVERFRHPPFTFALDRLISFRGRRPPYVLLCSEQTVRSVCDFRQALGEAVYPEPGTSSEPRFTPHVTLAYGEQLLPGPVPIEPIQWCVDEFVLIDSLVGKSVHRILHSWPLRA